VQVTVRGGGGGATLCVDVRCSTDTLARAPAAAQLRGDAGLRFAGELLRKQGGACDWLPGDEPAVVLRFPLAASQLLPMPVDAHVEADALDAQIAEE